MFQALLLALPLTASAQTWAPGADITDAASIQITKNGLEAISTTLPLIVPDTIPVDDVDVSQCQNGAIRNINVHLAVDEFHLVPTTGRLDIQVILSVWLNDFQDPMDFDLNICTLGSCEMYVTPFQLEVNIPVSMDVVYSEELGHNVTDVTLGALTLDQNLNEGNLQSVNTCGLTVLTQILDAAGISIVEFIWQYAEPLLLQAVNASSGEIEAQLEELMSAAYFMDTLEFAGAEVTIEVQPQDVVITNDGLEIIAQGNVGSEQAACMAPRDPGGSLRTPTPIPPITENPASTQIAVLVSDDIANQALYGIWRSGLFCFDLSDENTAIDLPIPLNTALLGIIGGDGYSELFPEVTDMTIVTNPDKTPLVDYTGGHDVVAQIRELGLDMYAEVDYRQARAMGIDLEIDAGLDIDFNSDTGFLALLVALGDDEITIVPENVELVKGSGPEVVANFGSLLDVILDTFLGDLLSDLAWAVPSLPGNGGNRVGLSTVTANDAGEGDWLRARATIGVVQYDNTEVSSDASCGSCNSSAPGATWAFGLLVPLLWRRRRE